MDQGIGCKIGVRIELEEDGWQPVLHLERKNYGKQEEAWKKKKDSVGEELADIAKEFSLSEEEISLICEEEGYIIRFKLADLWGKLLHKVYRI